jgi:LytS/YehU family sensor histidine kinase
MPGNPIELLGQLLQFTVRNAALVVFLGLISRLPMFRRLFYTTAEDSKTQVWFTTFWSIAAVAATKIAFGSAYVPLLAGRYGGRLPGFSVGLVAGGWLLLSGASMPAVIVHVLAGVVGGGLHLKLPSGLKTPGWVALTAGLLSFLGLDDPNRPGAWAAAGILSHAPMGLIPAIYLTLAFSIADFLFIRMMEFLMAEGERHNAQISVKVLQLANDMGQTLDSGLTEQAATRLAVSLRQELETAGVCVGQGERVVAFEGDKPHLSLNGDRCSGAHQEVFSHCPPGCQYTEIHIVPIGVADAWLGFLGQHRQPLTTGLKRNADALGAVLTGMLARAKNLEQKTELQEARHRFLQAQIRPHFLFNTLNTIASVAKDDETRDLVLDLATFLRESFRRDKPLNSLETELEIVECYLAIEKKRFRERLEVVMLLPETLPLCRLPSFSLQPLVENAVHHGIGQVPEGGSITVSVAGKEEGVEISVEDSGPGIPEKVVERVSSGEYSSEHIGMANVKARLVSHFGEDTHFQVKGARVSFVVPLQGDEM